MEIGAPTISKPQPAAGQELIRALQSPHREAAIGPALAALNSTGDGQLLVHVIQALVNCGVAGIATRLLRSAGAGSTGPVALAQMLEQVERLPSGEISLASIRDRFEHNIHVLQESQPDVASRLRRVSAMPQDLHVFVTGSGNVHIVRDRSDGGLAMVTPLADHNSAAQSAVVQPVAVHEAMLFAGVPSTALFERWMQSGFEGRADVVDPDAALVVVWLHLAGSQVFESGRIKIFTEEECWGEYAAFLQGSPGRALPTRRLDAPRPGVVVAPPERLLEDVAEQIAATRAGHISAFQSYYASRTQEQWWSQFDRAARGEDSLRVLALTTRHSTVLRHVMRDLDGAFRDSGHDFTIEMEADACGSSVDVPAAIRQHQPDLIVVLNHVRSEYGQAMPADVPYFCWIQDHMPALCTPEAGASVGERELVAGHSPGLMCGVYGYPRDRFLETSNLTDPRTYSHAPCAAADLESVRCDVSFVSHGAATPESLIDEMAGDNANVRALLSRFSELARAELSDRGWVSFFGLLGLMHRAEGETQGISLEPQQRADVLWPCCTRLYDRMFRHQAIEWLSAWAKRTGRSLHLYGKGWDQHPVFAEYARGEVENGEALRRVYQASTINIQANGYASLHPRLLDAIASGGMVMTRYNPNDWHLESAARIRQTIQDRGIDSLVKLRTHAARDSALQCAIAEFELLFGCRVLDSGEPFSHLRSSGLNPAGATDDEALFDLLANGTGLIGRAAGQIPGMQDASFNDQASLESALERYIDDELLRQRWNESARAAVMAHDTYDALVRRVVESFANLMRPTDL